jgi:site-specific recombinase XerD
VNDSENAVNAGSHASLTRLTGSAWQAPNPDVDLVADWITWLRDVRRRSVETVRSYDNTLQQWLTWLTPRPLALASLEDLEAFQQRPRQKRGHGGSGSAATQRREITSLRLFYKWAHARGHVESNPLAEALAPTVHNIQPKPVPDTVWLQTWERDMPNGLRSALGLGFFCGLRRAEIVGLSSTQLTDRRIVGFVRKGGGEDTLPWRTMVEVYEAHLPHLGAERFLDALAQSRRVGTGIVPFDSPDWMNRAMRTAGIPFTPHMLRHSCATNLIRADVPLPIVSRMLNHSSIDITMRYVKAGGDELKAWLTSRT